MYLLETLLTDTTLKGNPLLFASIGGSNQPAYQARMSQYMYAKQSLLANNSSSSTNLGLTIGVPWSTNNIASTSTLGGGGGFG